MTQREYQRMTEPEFRKRRWRLTEQVETTGGLTIAAGSEVRVTRKHGGLNVESPRCEHCGVTFRCRNVSPYALEEILADAEL